MPKPRRVVFFGSFFCPYKKRDSPKGEKKHRPQGKETLQKVPRRRHEAPARAQKNFAGGDKKHPLPRPLSRFCGRGEKSETRRPQGKRKPPPKSTRNPYCPQGKEPLKMLSSARKAPGMKKINTHIKKTLLCLCGLLLCSACGHMLEDGNYQLSPQTILKDDCGMAQVPGIFSSGRLRTTGDVVFFKYDFFEVQMTGFYLAATERWRADGNAGNVTWHVHEKACQLDEIRMSMEATSKTKKRFEGTLSISTHAAKAPECACELWVDFEAVYF